MKTKKRFGLQALVPYICLVMALFSLAGCKDLFHGEGMPNGPPDDPPEDGGSGPVIAALAQPAVGATTISIVVSGSFFNTSTAITDFAIGGAQASAVTALGTVTATQVTFTTTALAAGDVIMIQALATAFNPAASAASNTVTFTATATIPITSITYTVDSIAPTAAGHIWRNGATDIQVFDTALKTYTSGNGNYALMDALLTGLVTGDTVRFTSSNLIDELTHASTTADSTITIGANLTAAHFAPAVSLAGNATKGFAITGSLNPSVLTFGTTAGKSTYNGVEVTPVDGPIVLTPSSAIAITVKTGHASNVVKVASGSTITSLTVDSTSTLPTTGIQVARTGVTVAAAVATTVDASALTTGTVTVAGASTAAVTIDGVAITPASGTDSVVTKTAAAAMTLTSGAAGATVAIVSGTPAVTIEYPLTAITTNGGGSIIVPIAASGVAITATAATTVDISGLTTAGNTVLLSGNFAFALTTITGGSAYADVSGTVTGGTKVYNYAATPGSAAFSAGTITGFTLTNSAGAKGAYTGLQTCRGAKLSAGGTKLCIYGCLGYGDCTLVCQFGALSMGENGLPKVDINKCTGCKVCVAECPQGVLKAVPRDGKGAFLLCSNRNLVKGGVKKTCKVGCLKCGSCEKNCPEQAITLVNGLPVVDYAKCTSCGTCAEKCPSKGFKFLERDILAG